MKASSITDADRLLNICNQINNNNDHIIEHIMKISNKLGKVGIGNVPEKEDLYRSKLIALLEGLECENIPKLVKEGTVGMFEEIGIEIAKEVKDLKNIPFDVMKSLDTKINITSLTKEDMDLIKDSLLTKEDMDLIKDSLRYHFTGENNALEFYEGDQEKETMKMLNNIEKVCKKLDVSLKIL
jgi:hypothetical protein